MSIFNRISCRETGHFAFGIATFKTMEALGVSISHLFAERSLDAVDYHTSFLILAAVGMVPLLVYHHFVPEAEDLSDLRFPSSSDSGPHRGTLPSEAAHHRDYSVDESIDSSSAQLTRL